ncbi:mannosyltransferase [Microterricola gilva]|uniref:Mannosyltransferase n=1 Tax=Microterricola gilva TaxID=393267 RepID=A0A4Q8AKW3_9MICO|nr:glycosyltransferase family 39 protein [Microterricola gilva]RZU65134.1 mannosyltransferase [Microterricola gilva]
MQSAPIALERAPRLQRRRRTQAPDRRNRAAGLVGLFAFAVSLAGAWIPSYWFDEVATLMASRLSWTELFAFTRHIDVVHLAYYSLMKLWSGAFGESELATRSFSALAIGAAAAGLVVLASALTSVHVGVISGVVFAILPHTTFIGVEARSYALSAAIAVWSTVILLLALRSTRRRWWLVYAAVMTVGVYIFLYSILMLVAHGVYLVRHHRVRRQLLPWLVTAALVTLAALPLIWAGLDQKGQISWIAYEPTRDLWALLTEPAFQLSRDVAALACVAALLIALCFARRLSGGRRRLAGLALAWFFMPLLVLLMADAAVGSVFTPRYLSFAVPAVAVLLAIAFTLTPLKPVAWLLVLGLALACLPGYLAQRAPLAKNHGSDLAQIADHIEENALPGDGIFLDDPDFGNTQPRLALSGYPAAFANTRDVAFTRSFSTTGGFSDITRDLEWLGDGLDGIDRLWVVTAGEPGSPEARSARLVLGSQGFVDVSETETNLSTIVLFER